MFEKMLNSVIGTARNVFNYKGRSTRFEYWTFMLAAFIVNVILALAFVGADAISSDVGQICIYPIGLCYIALFVVILPLTVRRLHDVGLSGFWLIYLQPLGWAVIYTAYLLELDSSCNKVINNNAKIGAGSGWLGWILTLMGWTIGSGAMLFVILLNGSKKGANEYGPNPYGEE